MTAVEKADELVDKMYQSAEWLKEEDYSPLQQYQRMKQCALIAVDEIMKMGWNLPHYGNQEGYNYWYLVKQEIEKL